MGSKPWEFPQDLGVNSGSSTYSCMTLGTVLKKPHLQMRVIMGDQTEILGAKCLEQYRTQSRC